MTRPRVNLLRNARGRPVAQTIIRRAQVRAALQDLPRNAYLRRPQVNARFPLSASRVKARAAGVGYKAVLLIPVGRPLPDITGHVVQSVAVRRERTDWRRALITVGQQVHDRKFALPGIGHHLAVRRELVSPGVDSAFEPSARGELPLGFGRQFLACPSRIGFGVLKCDMRDRMPGHPLLQRTALTQRTSPTRALRVRPPVEVIAEVDAMRGLLENNRTGHERFRIRSRIVLRIQRTLGDRQEACRIDEAAELFVCDRRLVHPEAFDSHVMSRRFFGIMIIRSHEKSPAWYPRHVFTWRRARRLNSLSLLLWRSQVGERVHFPIPPSTFSEFAGGVIGLLMDSQTTGCVSPGELTVCPTNETARRASPCRQSRSGRSSAAASPR